MGERTRELMTLLLGDALLFVVALWITLLVRYISIPEADVINAHMGPFLMLIGVWIAVFFIAGLYDKHTVFLKTRMVGRIINTQIANIIIAAAIFISFPFDIAPKTNLVIYLVVSSALIVWWRIKLFT